MSLTKEMILKIDEEVNFYEDEDLLTYYSSYKYLNKQFPNSFYSYRVKKSLEEIVSRGIEDKLNEF